jgi:hypothetical protein
MERLADQMNIAKTNRNPTEIAQCTPPALS